MKRSSIIRRQGRIVVSNVFFFFLTINWQDEDDDDDAPTLCGSKRCIVNSTTASYIFGLQHSVDFILRFPSCMGSRLLRNHIFY